MESLEDKGPYNPYVSNNWYKSKVHFFKDLNLNTVLTDEVNTTGFTHSKVVITMGPAVQDVPVLVDLLNAGAAGARIDLTWGPLEFHRRSLENLQTACKLAHKLCATLVDTLGRELMIRRQCKIDENGWPTHEDSITVTAGSTIIITTRPDVEASSNVLPITYEGFPGMTMKGDTIYVGRYLVSGADAASLYLEVVDVQGPDVVCVAKNNALLDGLLTVFHAERSHNTLSNIQNNLPLLSEYDKECIQILAKDFELDFLSLSYTRTAEDVREARRYLDSIGCGSTKILAKVETRQALLNFQGILNEADGVIISRGNLGLDCLPEKMALVQKTLIQACNIIGKPALITRVVDTMVNTPRPTRAEATDVANAVLDGVDGILLGAETLRGKYPVETIQTIARICRSAERVFDYVQHYDHLMETALQENGPFAAALMDDEYADIVDGDGSASDLASLPTSQLGSQENLSMMAGSQGKANGKAMHKVNTYAGGSLSAAARAMVSSKEGPPRLSKNYGRFALAGSLAPSNHGVPYLSKLESIASSAVRAADKVRASLVLVYTHTGTTAQLVAKYRPAMPILTLVVPHLVSDGLKWRLEGRQYARQCLLTRGLLPMLASPSTDGEQVMEEAVATAARMGMVKPHDHVVCVQRIHEDFCVKIVSVDHMGKGVKKLSLARTAGCAESALDSPSRLGSGCFGYPDNGVVADGFLRSSTTFAGAPSGVDALEVAKLQV